eukprot:COSAG02_NODE_990_length_15413_cov_24.707457_12_plen_76_part_00
MITNVSGTGCSWKSEHCQFHAKVDSTRDDTRKAADPLETGRVEDRGKKTLCSWCNTPITGMTPRIPKQEDTFAFC